MPRRTVFNFTSASFIESRRVTLEAFLVAATKAYSAVTCRPLRAFLGLDDKLALAAPAAAYAYSEEHGSGSRLSFSGEGCVGCLATCGPSQPDCHPAT